MKFRMKRHHWHIIMMLGLLLIMLAGFFIYIDDPSEPHIPREVPEEIVEEPEAQPAEAAETPQERVSHDFELAGYDCSNVPGKPVEGEPTPSVDACDDPEEEVAAPQHITIDAIDVDHPIINVGLNDDGSMEIPHDVNELGWYEPGIKPGEHGSAVIAGHVDSRTQGPGAFFDLRFLTEGDEVSITDEEGVTRSWTVSRITRYDKNQIPMEEIFRWGGNSQDLVLITCGGEFDQTARSYQDNIVVYASPTQ